MENGMSFEQLAALGISRESYETVLRLEEGLAEVYKRIGEIETVNEARVLGAFIENGVAARHFSPSTGYGYDDAGRDTLDKVFAGSLLAEAAIVSPQLVSGTHAIFTVLSGLLRPGDVLFSVSGRPYDTLIKAIGMEDAEACSLAESGVRYEQVELTERGEFDLAAIEEGLAALHPRVVYFQRSRGYAWRESLRPAIMGEVFSLVRKASPESVIVVDNCYGEFTESVEPTSFGADIIVGSLIKNPGGGLAPTGGYFAGKRELVSRLAGRLTVPGIGREAGSYFSSYLPFYQGLFMAPHTVAQSLKTGALFARIFEEKGLETMPASTAARSDIVQSLRFSSKEKLIKFCRLIQSVSPVDSFAAPEPYAMPGYTSEVIMAAGAFVQGSSIELSADAPIVEPYTAYLQGGLSLAHGRLAAMRVLTMLNEQ